MDIGIPKEQTSAETRVVVTPMGAYALAREGHRVFVEKDAGADAGFSDEDYEKVGATVVFSPQEVYGRAEAVAKVQPPTAGEVELMREGTAVFSAVQLGARVDEAVRAMMEKRLVAFGYEIIEDEGGEFPVMKIISELVGHMLPSIAGRYLSYYEGGRGVALANLPGIPPAAVAIVGAGNVGTTAAKSFAALGVQTHLFDRSVVNLRRAEAVVPAVITHMAEPPNIARACTYTDVLVTAAYVHGDRPPMLVTEEMVRSMKAGAVLMDIAIDQGGCCETSRPTTHTDPVFEKYSVTHYCVPNIASAVPRTCSYAFNNNLKPYLAAVASLGVVEAATRDAGLRKGIYFYGGACTHPRLCDLFNLEYTPVEDVIGY
ncbi:MAG: alanine dehydrogenase [candidate division Zixibacteria bacterium]|nr:alanine dehydrogenase [candidate division Zixibacteria bacterium]